MRSRSLFLKYAIPLILLSSGAVIVSGLDQMYFSYLENKTALSRVQHEKAVAASIRIEQFARDLEHQVAWIAQSPWGPRGITLDQRRLDSLRLLRQVPAITEVSHIDPEGREQLKVSRLSMDVMGSGLDFSHDPKFTEPKRQKTWFSPVYFRKESEPYMTIALIGAGENPGVVAAEANLKFIWDVVSTMKVGEGGHAYVVDAKGRLIAHPDISLVLQNTDLSSLAIVRAATARGRTDESSDKAITGPDVQGREVLSASAPVSSLGWTVFVDLPLTEAFAPLYSSLARTGLLLLVGMAVSILASLVLVRRMVAPIHVLQTGAARIGAGALDQRIDVKTGDELQALGEEFNRMAETLQESYSGLERKVEERTRELSEALEQQTATSEILRVISQSQRDVQPVFDAIAENAQKLCEGTLSGVWTYDGELIHLESMVGFSPGGADAIRQRFPRRPVGGGSNDRAILTGGVVHIPDVMEEAEYEPELKQMASEIGFRSMLSVPMLKEGRPIGTIGVSGPRPGMFTARQVAMLETFADQAVIAIENVRLFNETREALERQTATADILQVISSSVADAQPVFEKITQSCQRLFRGSQIGINLVRPDGMIELVAYQGPDEARLRQMYPFPVGEDTGTGRATRERRVLHYPDALHGEGVPTYVRSGAGRIGARSTVFAPLVWENKGVGAIFVARDEVAPFSDHEIALLKTFADQAVIAIENTRLFKELEERNKALTEALEQQTATSEILRVISSSPTDLQPVLDAVAENAARLCNASDALIVQIDGEELRLVAKHGTLDTIPPGERLPIRRDLVMGRAILDRTIVHVADIETLSDNEYAGAKALQQRFGYRSVLVAPMLREGVAIGAIAIRRLEVGSFSDKQIGMLETFADQAVIAIENVRLFKELESRTQQLGESVEQFRALAEVSQAVNSTLDLEQVLSTIVSRAVQLSATSGGAVYEYEEAEAQLRLRATYGLEPDVVEAMLTKTLRLGEGAAGKAAQTRAPVEITQVNVAEQYDVALQKIIKAAGIRSLLAIPLLREGRVLGALSVSRNVEGTFPPDVTELLQTFAAQSSVAIQNARLFREIEQKGRELEVASRHKSQFLANMSHELRTPLNAILGYTELIVDKIYGEVPAKILDVLDRVQKSGRHLLGLINDVLDLSKIEAGQLSLTLSDYSFQDAVHSAVTAVESLAREKKLRLTVDIAPTLPVGRGDERRIVQVLLNLLGNAIKFTEEGEVGIRVRRTGSNFEVAVSDTGPGIPEAQHERIFEEFQQADGSSTREKGGSGLGLAIAKKIVELHGGRIGVVSKPGEGATFTFSVPVQAERREMVA